MSGKRDIGSNAIYGVGKLGEFYREFTCESEFTPSDKYRVMPSCGGSYFGDPKNQMPLDKIKMRMITSIFFNQDEDIKGTIPVGKLLRFKATNQEHYKSRTARYFGFVKDYLIWRDTQTKTDKCLWCFFPLYHRQEKHLFFPQIGAAAFYFSQPKKPTAKILDWPDIAQL